MRTAFLWSLCLMACGGSGGSDDVAGDDDDDDVVATHATTPWSEIETSQSLCCNRVTADFTWVSDRIEEGVKYEYVMPEDPIGAIVVLHGASGSVGAVQQSEWLELYNLLEPRGIGIMMTVSTDRDAGQWDNFTSGSDNVDVDRIEEMLGLVAGATDFEIDDPIGTVGFSNGASFSELLSGALLDRGRNVRGAVMHNGGSGRVDPSLPALWLSAENDTAGGGPSAMESQAASQGNGSLHLRGTEVAVDPYEWAKSSAYTRDESAQLFDLIVDMEWIDADGVRVLEFIGDPDDHADNLEKQLPVAYPSDVVYHLRVAWSLHRMSAQNKLEEAAWIEDQLLR